MSAKWIIDKKLFVENVKLVIKNTNTMAVVKNNAYNFGLQFAVEAFLEAGIRSFATTNLNEAIQIRTISDDATIFLMNRTTEFELVKLHNIHITLPSIDYYKMYKNQLIGINVHLEYENLLHRSGLTSLNELQYIITDQLKNKTMNITGLWTHFAYADEFEVDEYEKEKASWLEIVECLSKNYTFDFIHAQNSASYVRDGLFSNHTHSRLGIILYGARPYANLPTSITTQSLTVCSEVIQVRTLKANESAGYSFSYTANKDTRLAVIDIGYGDGVLRTRAKYDCLINNQRYNIKSIMMSHMFVEVDQTVKTGDPFILYNNDMRIDEYTFKGVGANSEQLSALNHQTLIKEIL